MTPHESAASNPHRRTVAGGRAGRRLGLLGLLLPGLLLAPHRAEAQSASSAFTLGVVGALVGPVRRPALPGRPATTLEPVVCTGPVKVETMALPDPALPATVVVSVNALGLACVGAISRARYVNTAQVDLTRQLAPIDQVQTTFALHRDTPGSHLSARTALLTLDLSFDVVTGALTAAAARVSGQ